MGYNLLRSNTLSCPFQGTDGEATALSCPLRDGWRSCILSRVPFKGRMAKPQGPAAIITTAAKTPVSSSQPLRERGTDTKMCPFAKQFSHVPFKGRMATTTAF
jgi:hypothetical protein